MIILQLTAFYVFKGNQLGPLTFFFFLLLDNFSMKNIQSLCEGRR